LGQFDEARRLLGTLEASASPAGLLPEQIWDSQDIPSRELFLGRPSGSAMPLAWAHAEHIKLLRSLKDGAVFDMPVQTVDRYVRNKPAPAPQCWRITSKITRIAVGGALRLEFLEPVRVHWSADNWLTCADSNAGSTGLGTYICDLPTQALTAGSVMRFTFFWTQQNKWQGENFEVAMRCAAASSVT
jgi:glucoamylase